MPADQPDAARRRYGPTMSFAEPGFAGIKTFAGCPHVTDMTDVDVAFVGLPFDTTASHRPGSRFAPEAIRSQSSLLLSYNVDLAVDVYANLSVVDAGDLTVTPGNSQRTAEQIAQQADVMVSAGVTPIGLGGEHSVTLGMLRAQARTHGPVAMLLLDSHGDTLDAFYDTERYTHGTGMRRAIEEGLIDTERSVFAGMRGTMIDPRVFDYLDYPRSAGVDVILDAELRDLGPAGYGERVRRRVGDGPVYLSFDIDFVDPAYAPATGVPEVGGVTSAEALAYVRSLAGCAFTGFDVVEVAPIYDGPGQITSLLAARVAWECLGLRALTARV